MRVVAVTTSFPRNGRDHAGRFVHDLHAGLVEEGHEVLTVCPAAPGVPGEEETEAGRVVRVAYDAEERQDLFYGDGLEANWPRVRSPLLRLRRFQRAAARCLVARGRGAHLVVAHWLWPGGGPAARAARSLGAPLLGVGHGGDLALLRKPFLGRWLARGLQGRLRGVLCTSRKGEAVVRRRLGVERVVVAPMGVNRTCFHPGAGPPPGAWPRGYFLGVGRLVPLKGFDLLVRAGARLGRPVVIAGTGPEEGRLRALASRLGEDVLLAGPLAPREVAAALVGAAAMVVPSRELGERTEGCPVVAVEALACGARVVAATTGGLPDLLPGDALFPPDDLEGLVAALQRVLASPPPAPPTGLDRRDVARSLLSLV